MPTRQEDAHERLLHAIQEESQLFQEYYLWLERSMPPDFFREVNRDYLMLIAHNLMGFHLQGYFSSISSQNGAIVLCVDSPDADVKILKTCSGHGIQSYRSYVSNSPPPVRGLDKPLRIGTILYTFAERSSEFQYPISIERIQELKQLVKKRNPEVNDEEFTEAIAAMDAGFIDAMPTEHLVAVLDMFLRARTRDSCQYQVRYNEEWQREGSPSMTVMLAWKSIPKANFLYRLARCVHRHGLVMRWVNASYVAPYSPKSILMMVVALHGAENQAAWDAANIIDFLREMATIKYFDEFDPIDEKLVQPKIISQSLGNLLRAMMNFIHQCLVHIDSHLYRMENVEEALIRHPELTRRVCELFRLRFDPDHYDQEGYSAAREELQSLINRLDTGNEQNDRRRKTIFTQAVNFVHYTLKTNYYRRNYTALAFRLDPKYLDAIPFNRTELFPELPFAIFFIKGMHYFAFHIRFKDLSRGGLRTVYTDHIEHMLAERDNVFRECYNLAYTQQKKNKDIPEGGAKAVIFLKPFAQLNAEVAIFRRERRNFSQDEEEIEQQVEVFRQQQLAEYLLHTQRSFIKSLLTLINCHTDGTLKAKYMVDYWHRPEYVYLGPDERMSDDMIRWIADYSRSHDYKPGRAFISSKPDDGINHKQYGVTSLGVNEYAAHLLLHLGIDPAKDPFTVKLSGGPDGDVAGNQIHNLYRFYPKTAKLLALIDGSGTIYDPEGLDLSVMARLFSEGNPIRYYPPEKLHDGGYLVDTAIKKEEEKLIQTTLCWRKVAGEVKQDWLSGSDTNHLLRHTVLETSTDLFIPAGGRPRTINASNYRDFLDSKGNPTARLIVEGANLYLEDQARYLLEEKGTLIIKDSSANKGGVICSSFEVLAGLTLKKEEFLEHKQEIIRQILDRIRACARNEVNALLQAHEETGKPLTRLSDELSKRINELTYALLDYLSGQELNREEREAPLIQCYLSYCLPILREKFQDRLLTQVPTQHIKAIISSHIASRLIYTRGIGWKPSVQDVLPVILEDPQITKGD